MVGVPVPGFSGIGTKPRFVADNGDIRLPSRGFAGCKPLVDADHRTDIGGNFRRRVPTATHVVEPVARTPGHHHACMLAVDGGPHREVVGLSKPLCADHASCSPCFERGIRAQVEFVPVHLAVKVERRERQLHFGRHRRTAKFIRRLRNTDVDHVGLHKRRKVKPAAERTHAPTYRQGILAEFPLENAGELLLRAESEEFGKIRVIAAFRRRILLQVLFVLRLCACGMVLVRRIELPVMIAA